jgi:hypothetical protein
MKGNDILGFLTKALTLEPFLGSALSGSGKWEREEFPVSNFNVP